MLLVEITRLSNVRDLDLPRYATEHSAGMDLLAAVESDVFLGTGQTSLIPCGIGIALPDGYEAQIRPRSGLALNHGITVLNAPGTIDADYRGEIKVILINHSQNMFVVSRGMRIAQMVISQYVRARFQEVADLSSSTRGAEGFGSTGT